MHIADRCEILVRGFARVGIIALVDEATGFQRDRKKDALSRILEAFIAKELQPYLPTLQILIKKCFGYAAWIIRTIPCSDHDILDY